MTERLEEIYKQSEELYENQITQELEQEKIDHQYVINNFYVKYKFDNESLVDFNKRLENIQEICFKFGYYDSGILYEELERELHTHNNGCLENSEQKIKQIKRTCLEFAYNDDVKIIHL